MPESDANRYQMTKSQHTFGAQPIDNPPPVYPPELVSANLAATIHGVGIGEGLEQALGGGAQDAMQVDGTHGFTSIRWQRKAL